MGCSRHLNVFLAICLVAQIFVCSSSAAGDLISDIFAARHGHRGVSLNVSSVVGDYIRVGDSESTTVALLLDYGFDISTRGNHSSPEDHTIIADRLFRRWQNLFLFPDRIRIIVEIKSSVVNDVWGTLVFLAP